jgi:hypothetical protein
VILELFSRRVVGWKLDDRLDAGLVHQALQNSLSCIFPAIASLRAFAISLIEGFMFPTAEETIQL